MKTCSKCKLEKELDSFCIDNSRKSGFHSTCKACQKEWRNKNSDILRVKSKEYILRNKDKRKEYLAKNKESLTAWKREYEKNKRASDPMYRVISTTRSRISMFCKSIQVNKNWNTLSAIGCGREDFKVYIESLFAEGMNWSNYGMGDGKWSIDHIKPLSTAQTEQDVFELSHYSNLQPMWWIENVIKSNKHQEQD